MADPKRFLARRIAQSIFQKGTYRFASPIFEAMSWGFKSVDPVLNPDLKAGDNLTQRKKIIVAKIAFGVIILFEDHYL